MRIGFKKKELWVPGQEIDMTRKTWGHSIEYLRSDGGEHRIVGWYGAPVRVGDCILDRFRREDGSEYVGHLQVLETEWLLDPSDMFFATVANRGPAAHDEPAS